MPIADSVIATLQPLSKQPDKFTSWEPMSGWLFLLPSRLPTKKGEIILPESHTKKTDSGICFRCMAPFGQSEEFLDKECFFPAHVEYRVTDTDTGYELYIVPCDKVIMTRTPPPEILAVSREKATDAPKFQTIEQSRKT